MKSTVSLSTPRAVKSQQVKERIYQAAIQLLHEYGYEYITVSNICTLAKVSVGSFYHHFSSKEALMANFFIEAYNDYARKSEQEYEDPIDDAIQYLCGYADFCQEQGLDFIRNFYTPFNRSMDMHLNVTASGEFSLPVLAKTAEKLQNGIAHGIFQEDMDSQQVSEDLCIIEKGCIYEWCVTEGSFMIRELSERLLRNYLKTFLK
jgi:AcrR family transcriptional regulator